jgi:hypothetical protein
VDEGVNRMREGASATIKGAKKERSDAADPLYEAAKQDTSIVDVQPIIGGITERMKTAKGGIYDALKKARDLLVTEGKRLGSDEAVTVPETRAACLA